MMLTNIIQNYLESFRFENSCLSIKKKILIAKKLYKTKTMLQKQVQSFPLKKNENNYWKIKEIRNAA